MALFSDGPTNTIEDLRAQDSQLMDMANTEGIDLTQKLSLAHEQIGVDLERPVLLHGGFLRRRRHRVCQRADVLTGPGRDAGDSRVMSSRPGHNELLGGHGSDTIHAGSWGDVIWGDYHPSGQPTSQHDRLYGGPARDFIYASHGTNLVEAGGGNDWIKAHFGRGIIDCGGGRDLLYISHKAMKRYKIRHCETISHKTLGY